MTPQPPHHDPVVGDALRNAGNPPHKPDFWNRLGDAIDAEPGPSLTSLSARRPPQRGRWMLLAAAVITVIGGLGVFAATRGGNDSIELEVAGDAAGADDGSADDAANRDTDGSSTGESDEQDETGDSAVGTDESPPATEPDPAASGEAASSGPAPDVAISATPVDYSQPAAPVDLGPGLVLGVNHEGTHVWVSGSDPVNPELGCEGSGANTIYAVSLATGDREAAVDSGVGISSVEIVRGPNGRVALIEGCEGFVFALSLGQSAGGRIDGIQGIALPPNTARLLGSGFAPDGTFWFAAGDFDAPYEVFAVAPDQTVETFGPFDGGTSEAFAVTADGTPVVAAGGELLELAGSNLMTIADVSEVGSVFRIIAGDGHVVVVGSDGIGTVTGRSMELVVSGNNVFDVAASDAPAAAPALAYTASVDDAGVELFLLAGRDQQSVSLGEADFGRPAFSPDGRVLVYTTAAVGSDGFDTPVVRAVSFGAPIVGPSPLPVGGIERVYAVGTELIFGDGGVRIDVGVPVIWVGAAPDGGFYFASDGDVAADGDTTLWHFGSDGRGPESATAIVGDLDEVFGLGTIDGSAAVLASRTGSDGIRRVGAFDAVGPADLDVPQLDGAQFISIDNGVVVRTFGDVDPDAGTVCGQIELTDASTGAQLEAPVYPDDGCSLALRYATLSPDGRFLAWVESVPFDDGPPDVVLWDRSSGGEASRVTVPFALGIDVDDSGSVLVSTVDGFRLIDDGLEIELDRFEPPGTGGISGSFLP